VQQCGWPKLRLLDDFAFKTGDRFDESGPGAHLAESTRRVQRESYARFLGFISTHRQDLMHLPPDARIDRLLVVDYVACHASRDGPSLALSTWCGNSRSRDR
jgi:hypothetical protein